jgi:hypothetical protein
MEEQWRLIAKEKSVSTRVYMRVYMMLLMERSQSKSEQAVVKTISVFLLAWGIVISDS